MAAIDDLISQITDESLRLRLSEEVSRLRETKNFGIVWENHGPELTALYGVHPRRGDMVMLKSGNINELYSVSKICNDIATCVDAKGKCKDFQVSDLVKVSRFGEPIYPTLRPMDSVRNAPTSSLWHTLIESDNYHALQLLEYLYTGKVDFIYIDPPYNSGAKDWKYNNDYVDSKDKYKHSKWLSMMEKRLQIAKRLLNPDSSTLVIAIDEKEYLHLGCLLEKIFSDADMQMVTTIVNAKGAVRAGKFSRVEEYLFILTYGTAKVNPLQYNMLDTTSVDLSGNTPVEWLGFRRREATSVRTARPNQFYPIFVDATSGKIHSIGERIDFDVDRHSIAPPEGCIAIWPLKPDGTEMLWSLTPSVARVNLSKGYLRVNSWNPSKRTGTIQYLQGGTIKAILNGDAIVTGYDEQGAIQAYFASDADTISPKRVWNMPTHNAENFGTNLVSKFLDNRSFPFPKSVYAIEDVIRFFVKDNPDAFIIDFFAGSGTTLHAVNLLNAEDNGRRRCVMVTNNEVGESESRRLSAQGLHQGDPEWEARGIARYVTWPRTVCSIKGESLSGAPITDTYILAQTIDKPIEKNIKQLTFGPTDFTTKKKKEFVSLLGRNTVPQSAIKKDTSYIADETYSVAILFDDEFVDEWLEAIATLSKVKDYYVFTTQNKLFEKVKQFIIEEVPTEYTTQPATRPMAEGFAANCEFFKLEFLDKTSVALGRQFKEILPLLWLRAGAIGVRPTIDDSNIPDMLIMPENNLAILTNINLFADFRTEIERYPNIQFVYIVTDSSSGFQEMSRELQAENVIQLYRDYLDNFRINAKR